MISKIHYITQGADKKSQLEAVKTFCQGGADWVQLRIKNADFTEWLAIAKEARSITEDAGAKLIINDSAQIAAAVQADGVHVGKNDMHPLDARDILGTKYIVGATANTYEDVQFLVAHGVDYIGFGPFRFTETKKNLSPIVGLSGFQNIVQQCALAHLTIPMIGIGGIKVADTEEIMATGLHGIAVSSEVLNATNPLECMKQLQQKVNASLLVV